MKKTFAMVVITVLSVVSFVGCDSGTSTPDTTPATGSPTTSAPTTAPPTTTPPTTQPVAPATFTGVGNKVTTPFTIANSACTIEWSYTPDPQYPTLAVFSFFVYPVSGGSMWVGSPVMVTGNTSTSDTTMLYNAPSGQYYLDVGAANIIGWTIKITQ